MKIWIGREINKKAFEESGLKAALREPLDNDEEQIIVSDNGRIAIKKTGLKIDEYTTLLRTNIKAADFKYYVAREIDTATDTDGARIISHIRRLVNIKKEICDLKLKKRALEKKEMEIWNGYVQIKIKAGFTCPKCREDYFDKFATCDWCKDYKKPY